MRHVDFDQFCGMILGRVAKFKQLLTKVVVTFDLVHKFCVVFVNSSFR